ncbi:hypothetical protein ASE88_02070 [Sphingomonas sp. Leaf38]|nr:hypothetical protein ASE88_02070 [Sphingomonas sp. Leaf38]
MKTREEMTSLTIFFLHKCALVCRPITVSGVRYTINADQIRCYGDADYTHALMNMIDRDACQLKLVSAPIIALQYERTVLTDQRSGFIDWRGCDGH